MTQVERTLETWSNLYLVMFYKDRLQQLIEGGNLRKIFTPTERRNLRKYEVLRYEGPKGSRWGSRRMVVTEEALRLLELLEEINPDTVRRPLP